MSDHSYIVGAFLISVLAPIGIVLPHTMSDGDPVAFCTRILDETQIASSAFYRTTHGAMECMRLCAAEPHSATLLSYGASSIQSDIARNTDAAPIQIYLGDSGVPYPGEEEARADVQVDGRGKERETPEESQKGRENS